MSIVFAPDRELFHGPAFSPCQHPPPPGCLSPDPSFVPLFEPDTVPEMLLRAGARAGALSLSHSFCPSLVGLISAPFTSSSPSIQSHPPGWWRVPPTELAARRRYLHCRGQAVAVIKPLAKDGGQPPVQVLDLALELCKILVQLLSERAQRSGGHSLQLSFPSPYRRICLI